MPVLVTDGLLRQSLAVTRSLGSRGIRVGVGETTRFNPAAFSKYCKEAVVYPDQRLHPDLFFERIMERIQHNGYRVFFPVDDAAMTMAIGRREELSGLCHLPIPPTESFTTAIDKGLSVQAALAAGVDAPKSEFPASLEQVAELARRLSFPIVIKPRLSSGSRGIRIARDMVELLSMYDNIHRLFPFPILQEYIPAGDRYDVCFLYDQSGQLKASFVQRELRHFPHPIGPSTMQESVEMPELVERAKAIMARLPWYGIAELEFMVDPRDGIPKFMEINPRFWASLHLAIQSGVDFPWMLYEMATGKNVENVFDYRIGERCRNLLPGELLHFISRPDRMHIDPPVWSDKRQAGEDDILSWKDPLPVLGFASSSLRFLFSRKVWTKLLIR